MFIVKNSRSIEKLKNLFNKFFLKSKQILYKFYINNVKDYLILSSSPFISGDTFKLISNHVYEKNNEFNYKLVKERELIFIKSEYFFDFMNKNYKLLPRNLIIISHNSDLNFEFDVETKFNLKDKNINLFLQNLNIEIKQDSNIHLLPIGFENRNWFKNGKISVLKKKYSLKNKLDRIYCSFNISTNVERVKLLNSLDKNNVTDYFRRTNHRFFIQTLSKYKICVCPPGNGIDTHRIWESLLVETLPIVLESDFSKNLKNLGIPIHIVKNWSELEKINENVISKLYSSYSDDLKNKEFLNIDYWNNKFNEIIS